VQCSKLLTVILIFSTPLLPALTRFRE